MFDSYINFASLPFYITVKRVVDRKTNTVKVFAESLVHVNKVIELPMSFTIDFVRSNYNQFLQDVLLSVVKTYGLKLSDGKYE